MALIAALIAAWWAAVVATRSVIFPTPWAVVTGTLVSGTLAAGEEIVMPAPCRADEPRSPNGTRAPRLCWSLCCSWARQ